MVSPGTNEEGLRVWKTGTKENTGQWVWQGLPRTRALETGHACAAGTVSPERWHQRPGMRARQARSTPNPGIRGRACVCGRHGLPRTLASEAGRACTAGMVSPKRWHQRLGMRVRRARSTPNAGIRGRACARQVRSTLNAGIRGRACTRRRQGLSHTGT